MKRIASEIELINAQAVKLCAKVGLGRKRGS
jgi:hypothetical protein